VNNNLNKSSIRQSHSPTQAKGFLLYGLLLVLVITQFSCVKYSQLLYFRDQPEFTKLEDHPINNQVRIKIQPDDVLHITVKALDQEAAEPFNLFGAGQQAMGQLALNNPSLAGYLVDPNGNIDLPVLGRISIAGLTIEEAKDLLAQKLEPYLKDPAIIIRFINFRYTVLGEVGASKTINVPGERITILEAIGQAGDLTPYSNREKIMVIREQNGKREFGYVNIHSPEIFQSPYFYLQQNDIVYVEPTPAVTATVRDPISEVLPLVSGILSIAALLIAFTR
jgi:polysaccharide export outer membrane protein